MLDLDGVDNIIFDLGGVVLNIDYERTSKAFRELGFKEFDTFYSQKEQTSLFDLFETGEVDSDKFLTALSAQISDASLSDLRNAWNAMLLDLPANRINLLRNLKADFRIFLLSNTNAIHEAAFYEIVGRTFGSDVFDEVFEKVYLSHRIGYRKPNADCFKLVINENKLVPERTLFIDDSIQHVRGAADAKIRSFHLEKGMDIIRLFPDKFQSKHH